MEDRKQFESSADEENRIPNETQAFEFSFDDILAVSSGVDPTGAPNSAISVALFGISDNGEIDSEESVVFRDAVNNFVAYENTVIVESEFSNEAAFELRRAAQIIQEWVPNIRNEKYLSTHEIHFIVTPIPLFGQLIMDLKKLMYSTLYRNSADGKWHLIMAFSVHQDDGSVDFIENEQMDIEQLHESIKLELARQEADLKNEFAAVTAEIEQLNQKNLYEEHVKDVYNNAIFEPSDKKEDSEGEDEESNSHDNSSWMRISKDE